MNQHKQNYKINNYKVNIKNNKNKSNNHHKQINMDY